MQILDRLAGLEEKFEQFARQMADPGMVSDPERYRQIAKSYAELERIILKFREYKEVARQARETQALLADEEMKAMAREELSSLEISRDALIAELRTLLLPKDPNDEKNVIVEIRAGAGGDEAGLFAGEVMQMYLRYADKKGWKSEIVDMSAGNAGGIKDATLTLSGEAV